MPSFSIHVRKSLCLFLACLLIAGAAAAQSQPEIDQLVDKIRALQSEIDALLKELSPSVREEVLRRLTEEPPPIQSAPSTPEPVQPEQPAPAEESIAPEKPTIVQPPPPVEPTIEPSPQTPPAARPPTPMRASRCNTIIVLDSNGDGRVDASDRYWRFLDVWIDDGDGRVEEKEIESLYDHQVREISLSLSTFRHRKRGLGEILLDDGVVLDLKLDGFGPSSRRDDGLLAINFDGLRRAGGATYLDQDGKELIGKQVIRPGWSVRTIDGAVALTCP